ncbi:translocon-associated protein subunit delta [Aethina tumida]|uniref:translocon-associated protein subunit delta n=1 Tax=Aethina tumida TaxID=116153 RepID=UPI00096B2BF3|nr:translocon-associated protein subunit delta [Aethina tumida]
MAKLLGLSVLFCVFAAVLCDTCKNVQVTSKSFTTQDVTIVTNVAYISEFSVQCGSGALNALYAEIEGNVVPVSSVGPNKYQVSWTEDPKTAKRGDRVVRLFDEDGYTALRKAIRAGEDVSSVSELANVVINHPGAYSGPWLRGEVVATIISIVIAYFAIVSKSKVVS